MGMKRSLKARMEFCMFLRNTKLCNSDLDNKYVLNCSTSVSYSSPFREQREQQKSQDGPAPRSRSRTSESGGNARHTPPVPTDEVTPAPSSKPNWAEEGGSSWGGQTSTGPYQVRPS